MWSLGVLLYEMLVGRLPFTSANPEATKRRILTSTPNIPSRVSELGAPRKRRDPKLSLRLSLIEMGCGAGVELITRLLVGRGPSSPATAENIWGFTARRILGTRLASSSLSVHLTPRPLHRAISASERSTTSIFSGGRVSPPRIPLRTAPPMFPHPMNASSMS